MSVRVLGLAAALGTTLVWTSSSLACGTGGYSYAGFDAQATAFGIAATITPLGAFDISSGHVAAWVGVGGPRQGSGGSDEWLQVGFSSFPDETTAELYYEVALPTAPATYHTITSGWPFGKSARVAVLEIRGRPNIWRVWVNGSAASQPIRLPASHGRWRPVATAESFDEGASQTCNGFLYRFHGVAVARDPGGGWHAPVAAPITDAATRLKQDRKGSFLAAEGDEAVRLMASFSP